MNRVAPIKVSIFTFLQCVCMSVCMLDLLAEYGFFVVLCCRPFAGYGLIKWISTFNCLSNFGFSAWFFMGSITLSAVAVSLPEAEFFPNDGSD